VFSEEVFNFDAEDVTIAGGVATITPENTNTTTYQVCSRTELVGLGFWFGPRLSTCLSRLACVARTD
jgi:hypothetical protein